MRKLISKHFIFINRLLARRYRTLLIFLIIMIIVPSFIGDVKYQGLASFILNSLVVFLSIHAIQESRKELIIWSSFAIIVIIINQLGVFKHAATIDFYLSFIIYIVFYAFVAIRLLIMILRTQTVNAGVLYASVLVYLFLGIIGGYLFMLIENAIPGSLQNLSVEDITNPSKFFYFSFITLSTVGYGDIVPNLAPSRALSMILSTTGPLYLTILVALLVSRFDHLHDK